MGRGGCKVVAANSIISWEPEAGEALGFNILTPSLTQPEISCHVAIGKPCQLGSSSSWKLRPPSTHPVLLTASRLSVCLSVCFRSVSPFVYPRSFRVAADGFRFRCGYRWRMKRVGSRLNEVRCFSREAFSSWLYAGCTLAVNSFSVKRRPVKMISRVRVELQMETWIIVGSEKRNLKKVCVGVSWYGLDISQWNANAWIGSFLITLRNESE